MNPGYPKICKNFKFGNIPQNNALETSNYSKFVEEVFLLSLKAFLILKHFLFFHLKKNMLKSTFLQFTQF